MRGRSVDLSNQNDSPDSTDLFDALVADPVESPFDQTRIRSTLVEEGSSSWVANAEYPSPPSSPSVLVRFFNGMQFAQTSLTRRCLRELTNR